jgi:SAM-dependent methyltransferase
MTYKYEMGLHDHIRNSDEKVILARSVGNIIRQNNVKSLLDVGAGEGTFASMVAPQVEHYVATEKRKENADALRAHGLEVIEKSFPFEMRGWFDMVLASHSIPNDKKSLEPFIEHLVNAAAADGTVCVVTYKREKDLWYEFTKDILKENWENKDGDMYEILLDVFKHYGTVTVEKVDTSLFAKTPRELFDSLRFTYAGKDRELVDLFNEHKTEGLAWIENHCARDNEQGVYKFPFIQYIVTLKKDTGNAEKVN